MLVLAKQPFTEHTIHYTHTSMRGFRFRKTYSSLRIRKIVSGFSLKYLHKASEKIALNTSVYQQPNQRGFTAFP